MRLVLFASIASFLFAQPLEAQFVTPLPTTRSPNAVAVARFQSDFDRFLNRQQRPSVDVRTLGVADVDALRVTFCNEYEAEDERIACTEAINPGAIVERGSAKPVSQSKTILPFRVPGFHRRSDVEAYLRSASSEDGLSLFSRFAANISDDEAYVVSDVISGLAGRGLFAINYAAVVVKSDSVPEEDREAVESQRATVIRMINNGGTLTARYQLPMYAHSGPTLQSASSVYATAGLIGPIGNSDSLAFAGGFVFETTAGISIRDATEAASLIGDLLLAGRIGYSFSEDELLTGTNDKALPYAQFAVGLRQNANIGLSALVTWALDAKYKDFAPKLVVNFSALR